MITIDPPRASPIFALSKTGLTRFFNRVRDAAGVKGEIEVLLADDTTLRRLNRTFRGKNKPTDVLSFPAAEMNVSGQQILAGDLAISLDTAARQAAEHGLTLRDEVRILLLHGTLHLAGYDHETDSGEMAARETELRQKLRLPAGLIARSEKPPVPGSKLRPPARNAKAPARKAGASNPAKKRKAIR
jgi:probable rRNA maturation factor